VVSRADLSRMGVLVVALFLTAAAPGAFAREFPTCADTIDLNRTNAALIGKTVLAMNALAIPFLFRSIEHAQKVLDGRTGAGILDSFEPYGFVLIERIRKAE
jgi:hypothetical protein